MKGGWISLSNAWERYGVTRDQCMEAKIPCRRRSSFGNSYAVVPVADVINLKKKLDAESNEEEKKQLIEELGEEGYRKMLEEKEREKEEKKAAEEAKAKREQSVKDMKQTLILLQTLGYDPSVPDDEILNDESMIGKTAAKKIWGVDDSDLAKLNTFESGRFKQYKLLDVIPIAQEKRHGGVRDKLEKRGDKEAMKQLAVYLRGKRLNGVDADVIREAQTQVMESLEKEVAEQQKILQEAQASFDKKNAALQSIRKFSDFLGKDTAAEESPKKKAKTSS